MKINIRMAESCGFCFGVRRAVETVYELRQKTDKPIYIIGELIHNRLFIQQLEKDGIYCIDQEDVCKVSDKEEAVFVIRTHGIPKQLNKLLERNTHTLVDATCPFVKRIHKIVEENSDEDTTTFIVGDKNHPEVIGIQSYAKGDTIIFSDIDDYYETVNKNDKNSSKKVLLVSQTTGNNEKYVNCQKIIKKLYTNAKIFDTICNVTENRQNEVKSIAKDADIMCVIGCTKSSNTKKLYEIAKSVCSRVYLLEQAKDVPEKELVELLHQKRSEATTEYDFNVGITAGASTPDDIIEEVKVRIEEILYSDEKQNDGHIND